MRTQSMMYAMTIVFSGAISQFLMEFLVLHSDFILEKLIIIIMSSIFQFFIIIPFLKGRLRKSNEAFFTGLKVQDEVIKNNEKELAEIREELKDTKAYLVGVQTEVRKFYYAETEIQKSLINVSGSLFELQKSINKLSSESGVIRTMMMNSYTGKSKDNE